MAVSVIVLFLYNCPEGHEQGWVAAPGSPGFWDNPEDLLSLELYLEPQEEPLET